MPADHVGQINRVIDHINARMEGPLPMGELIALTAMSRWHFHRVFVSVTGEPPARYIARRRLERAAALLLADRGVPVSEVAYRCGFGSASVFCRNFRRRFGVTPGRYRGNGAQQTSNDGQPPGNGGTALRPYSHYLCPMKTTVIEGKTMQCNFEIKSFPAQHVIYCRHKGPYDQMGPAFSELLAWAFPRGLVGAPGHKLMSVYHDDPKVTPAGRLTSDAGMIVSRSVCTDGRVGSYTISEGLYAEGSFEIAMEEFPRAWAMMYELVARHGCRPAAGNPYEVYNNNRDEHPGKKWLVDIRIPVEMI